MPVEQFNFAPEDPRKVYLLKPRTDVNENNCCCLEINRENHTLGNPLRHVAMCDPRVEFAGYCMPHPTEDVVNMRIQLYREAALEMDDPQSEFPGPIQVFKETVEDLEDSLRLLMNTLNSQVERHRNERS